MMEETMGKREASGPKRGASALVSGWRWLASFRHLSLIATLSLTAHAHWTLATTLAIPVLLRPMVPVAIDAYVLASFRAWEAAPGKRRLDLVWALGLDMLAVAGAHAASQVALPQLWLAGVAAVLGVVLVLVLWRVHALDMVTPRRAVSAQVRASEPRREPVQVAHAEPVHGPTLVRAEPVSVSQVKAWVAAQKRAGHGPAQIRSEGLARFGQDAPGLSLATIKRVAA